MSGAGGAGAALSVEKRRDGIALVVWDESAAPGANPDPVRLEGDLEAVLAELARWPAFAGLVFAVAGSAAGAARSAYAELRDVRRAAEGAAIARRTQELAARIASLPVPSVAALRGPCRGRAFAFALAADARIASTGEGTFFAWPEVRLGLVPSGGIAVRLPGLVGVAAALDFLLNGREVSPAAALRQGLVDRLGSEEGVIEEALALVRSLRESPPRPARAPRILASGGLEHLFLARNPVGRGLLFRRIRRRVIGRTRGRGPAPERLLRVVHRTLARGVEAGLALEANAFGELAASTESRTLLGLLAAREEAAGVSGEGGGAQEARPVKAVAVLGAGPTGAGIAGVSAMHAGVEVRLSGGDAAAREGVIARLRGVLDGQVRLAGMTRVRRDAILHRVRPVSGRERLGAVDLVIDAEPGSLEDKHRTLAALEGFKEGRIFYASALSFLPIARLAAPCTHPGNVLGLRYSRPVERMPLLEVVAGEQSASRAVATCVAFGRRQGKTTIVVGDGPAFYCSRIFAPCFHEALWQLAEGVAIESIDWALVDSGFAVGPFARADDIGIDVGVGVSRLLHEAFGERMRPPPAMARLLADGRFGRRSGRGFYHYEIRGRERRGAVDGSVYTSVRSWPSRTRPAAEIAQRCILAMVNEAAYCLGEGVIRSARDGDVGAVFGAGFPSVLGGPFRYVDALGAAYVVERLKALAALCGDRFHPAPLLEEMAGRAGHFYPEEG